MQIERKALYNLLRMNWLNDPTIDVKPWQVEDYRNHDTDGLFKNLSEMGLHLDKTSFLAYAETVDTPENLTDSFLVETELDPMQQDHIYLLIFEIWRRLVPEKMSLSIFCDELDHQIYLYDNEDPSSAEFIQDAIANLQVIIDENVDQGMKPDQIFESVSNSCANDLESFLYDFISEQIDNENFSYASELLEGFNEYLKGSKWFELLRVRLLETSDPEEAQEALRKIVQKAVKEEDLPYNFEVLSFIVQGGKREEFNRMVRKTVPFLEAEEDFQDLLAICGNYYRCLDEDQKEQAVQSLLDQRADLPSENSVNQDDPNLTELLKIIR